MNKALEKFDSALTNLRGLAARVREEISVPKEELATGLRNLFRTIIDCSGEVDNGTLDRECPLARSVRRDVLETWDNFSKDHLPVSLALLRLRYRDSSSKTVEASSRTNGVGQSPDTSADNRPPILLLMSGYSIEQLVLCIGLQYHEQGVRRVVPFAGKTPTGGVSWLGDEVCKGLQFAGITVGGDIDEDDDGDDGLLRIASAVPVDASHPARVFQEILKWSRVPQNARWKCTLDVTGGQKPMDSGASYAATYLGWPAHYLDFTDYEPTLRRPKPQSLVYKQLVLPAAAFSHDARRDVVSHFRGRRFRLGLERLVDIRRLGSDPLYKEFFPPEDMDALEQALKSMRTCVSLMGADYHSSVLRDVRPELHAHFEQSAGQSLRTSLHALMRPPAVEGAPDAFLQYVADEYWRLESLYRMAAGDEARDEAGVDYSEGIRDVIVGTVGLSELIVDSLFLLESGTPTIVKVSRPRPTNIPDYKANKPFAELFPQHLSKVNELLKQGRLPWCRVPKGRQDQKKTLIRTGKVAFEVWCPADLFDNTDFTNAGAESFATKFAEAFLGTEEVESPDKSKYFRVEVNVKLRNTLLSVDDPAWRTDFGDFGNSDADWFGTRHIIAHMRAPMRREQFELAMRALTAYLPRFVGLLAAMRAGHVVLPMSGDDAFDYGSDVLKERMTMMPWYAAGVEDRLRDQLRLARS